MMELKPEFVGYGWHFFAGGEAEARAEPIIGVLAARGVPMTELARERIISCTDPDQLDEWLDRAATMDLVDALFA